MRIFDAHIYALLLNTHIYGGTKHAYICVQNALVFAYETRIYLRTRELPVSLAGITNSTQRILIRTHFQTNSQPYMCMLSFSSASLV